MDELWQRSVATVGDGRLEVFKRLVDDTKLGIRLRSRLAPVLTDGTA